LKITGTIGVIIKAKLQGITPSIKPYLAQIKKTDFRVSEEIIRIALREAGEE
jgi:predicted nucleic acid-binding protein